MKTILLCLLTVLGGTNVHACDNEPEAAHDQLGRIGFVSVCIGSATLGYAFFWANHKLTEYPLHTAVCENRDPRFKQLLILCGARERLDHYNKTALHRTLADTEYYNSRTHKHCYTTKYDPTTLRQLLDQHKKGRIWFGDTPSQDFYNWALQVGLDKRAQDDEEKMKKGLTVQSPQLPTLFTNSDLEELSHYTYNNQGELICQSSNSILSRLKDK